ncbi:hypothetical protein [Flammeovirga aprica]|uniref:Uncharacterized protein n=1 Tax=Flammeovirga aprica JL-4 TaxID=694437 RepID=A0A7X9XDG5_9BACT|nr:hypothetical protein [Flammeovirga aprica]NME72822.1 hypothetical protein [Flammeovirga aprica JL-4]
MKTIQAKNIWRILFKLFLIAIKVFIILIVFLLVSFYLGFSFSSDMGYQFGDGPISGYEHRLSFMSATLPSYMVVIFLTALFFNKDLKVLLFNILKKINWNKTIFFHEKRKGLVYWKIVAYFMSFLQTMFTFWFMNHNDYRVMDDLG